MDLQKLNKFKEDIESSTNLMDQMSRICEKHETSYNDMMTVIRLAIKRDKPH